MEPCLFTAKGKTPNHGTQFLALVGFFGINGQIPRTCVCCLLSIMLSLLSTLSKTTPTPNMVTLLTARFTERVPRLAVAGPDQYLAQAAV